MSGRTVSGKIVVDRSILLGGAKPKQISCKLPRSIADKGILDPNDPLNKKRTIFQRLVILFSFQGSNRTCGIERYRKFEQDFENGMATIKCLGACSSDG